MTDAADALLFKARESLLAAESEFANGRFNNSANRSYYACFQAAVHALDVAGVRPAGRHGRWSHSFVPAQFDGVLIASRKLYPPELRNTLSRNDLLRQTGDYDDDVVTELEAGRALRRARRFLDAIEGRRG